MLLYCRLYIYRLSVVVLGTGIKSMDVATNYSDGQQLDASIHKEVCIVQITFYFW